MIIDEKNIKSALRLEFNVTISVIDNKTGVVLAQYQESNLMPLVIRNLVRDFLNTGTGITGASHFAVGTGTTSPASGDTALQTEVHRAAITKKTTDSGKLTIQQYLGSSEANGYTLTEAGVLNASSGGSLFSRVTYTGIEKTSSVSVIYSWDYNINAG